MIADKLRKSVLQAAIQGKLTDRRPGDGDARDLLAEIAAEKARLVKEGVIRRAAPLPPVGEGEAPFDIPEGWCWCTLKDITHLVGNKNNQIQESRIMKEGKYPVVSQGQKLIDGYYDDDEKVIRDLPLVMFGDHTRNVKYIDFPFIVGADGTKFMKPIGIEPRYFYYYIYLTADILRKRGYARHFALLKKQIIPLPPLAEQRRIVARLEELLPLIEGLAQAEKELEAIERAFPDALRKALLQAAIEGKLTEREPGDGDARDLLAGIAAEKARLVKEGVIRRTAPLPPVGEDEAPFDIPEGWCWVRLGEITNYATGRQTHQKDIPAGTLIVELEDIEKESCRLLEKHYDRTPGSSKNRFSAGDVLYGKLRPYLRKAVILNEPGYCSTEIIPFRGYGGIEAKYLMYVMISPEVDRRINSLTYGMDMPRLGRKDAVGLSIPLPPLAEQRRIVARLEELLPLVDDLAAMEAELGAL